MIPKHRKDYSEIIQKCDSLETDPWSIMCYDRGYPRWKRRASPGDIIKAFNYTISLKNCVLPTSLYWENGRRYRCMEELDRMGLIPTIKRKLDRLLKDIRYNHLLEKALTY